MYPIILSVSSGDPRGRGLNVIFITEYHEAMTPLNKLQEKYPITIYHFKTMNHDLKRGDILKVKLSQNDYMKFTCKSWV